MPILYLDEDVKGEIANLLIAPDRSVRTVRGERRLRAGDPYQPLFAAQRDWILVTCNREDYHLLHDAWLLWAHHWGTPRMHAGILTLDQGHPTAMTVAAIDSFFRDDHPPLRNRVYDWSARDGNLAAVSSMNAAMLSSRMSRILHTPAETAQCEP